MSRRPRPSPPGWAAALAGLTPEAREVLTPWVRRLSARLGPVPWPAHRPRTDTPDGLAGLGRRGPWERATSETWALAEHAPDLFLQRVADGEVLFREVVGARRRGGLGAVVVVDGGPRQLGLARLAQLAVVAVLHRRVEALGGTLWWARAQDRPEGLVPVDGGELEAVRTARTLQPVTPADRRAWAEPLGPRGVELVERWWVGPPGTVPTQGAWREVAVEETHRPDGTPGPVRVTVDRGPVVRLPRPEDGSAVRALAGGGRRGDPTASERLAVPGALAWWPEGSGVWIRQGRRLTAWRLGPRARCEDEWWLPAGEVLAVGPSGRGGPAVLGRERRRGVLWSLAPPTPGAPPRLRTWILSPEGAWPAVAHRDGPPPRLVPTAEGLWLRDGSGEGWVFPSDPDARVRGEGPVAAAVSVQQAGMRGLRPPGAAAPEEDRVKGPAGWAYTARSGPDGPWAWAWPAGDGAWRLAWEAEGMARWTGRPGERVVGLRWGREAPGPQLVVADPADGVLTLWDPRTGETEALAAVALGEGTVAAATVGGAVAWLEASGRLGWHGVGAEGASGQAFLDPGPGGGR